jgi:hypothetical protein
MALTCPHCHETIEEPQTGTIQFCLHCGEPVGAGAAGEAPAEAPDRRDSLLRLVMMASGVVWLVLFFIPFGRASYGAVMSWDLLADQEGMSYLVSWPLMLGILFLVLGAVAPFPAWLRAGTAVLLGGAFLILLGSEDPGGPLGAEIQFVFMGDAWWILVFPLVGAGLMLRAQAPRSATARVLVGLALLFGLVAYLTGAEGESTLVGALLRYLGDDTAVRAICRVFLLLPLFLLIASSVGFKLPAGGSDPARSWSRVLSWVWLGYLPAILLLYGLMRMATEESGYYFLMFFKLAVYTAGLLFMLMVSVAWLSEFLPAQIRSLVDRKS